MESLRVEAVEAVGLWDGLRGDIAANLGPTSRRLGVAGLLLRAFASPEVRLCLLVRLAARAPRRTAWIWRNLLMSLHASEVQPGAILGPGLRVPHPFGLAIGATTRTGAQVTLEHNTTFAIRTEGGRLSPRRLAIGDGARVLTNTVIMGGVQIGPDAVVAPHSVVTHRVRPGAATAGHSRH
jgi:serine O-acetyltransferase